ncbi:MAG: sigma-70 family RNA polymerase sigma factor [Armatimonadota bacterium]
MSAYLVEVLPFAEGLSRPVVEMLAIVTTNRVQAGRVLAWERLMVEKTDQAVVQQVLEGETDAFSELVQRYQDRIYSVALNYVSNPEDAMDIAQETFVKAYSNLNKFDSASAFYTWLYRIAVNTAIDFLRKRKVRPADSLDDEKFTEIGFEPESRDRTIDPEEMAAQREQARILRKAISGLSNKLRTVLILHDVEGLSQEEVAQILRIPVGTVKSRVSRARAELRKVLRKAMGDGK